VHTHLHAHTPHLSTPHACPGQALYATLVPAAGPWSILPLELLHGITFAAAWGACTVHAGTVAPPALAASFQGVMQAAWLGLGAGLGGLAGGVLMERGGGQALFGATAAAMAGAAAAAAAARRLSGSRHKAHAA
jgi:predicted MFS family arabinose efflux permease